MLTTTTGAETCLAYPSNTDTSDVDFGDEDMNAPTEHLELPLTIRNIAKVDDAGDEQIECVMTAGFLLSLYEAGLLTFDGNIRPAHQGNKRLTGKTKTKVDKWTSELLRNEAIIGNISIRLDPTKADFEIWTDDETGELCVTIDDGVLDCAVDSLSRIKAIIAAARNPFGSLKLTTRFQVRVWLLDDEQAKKVATIYNTRGDKVNDSAAKYAYSETEEQKVARKLVNASPHLGLDNVEVLSNAVSWSSNKLTAFNTISKALELSWKGGPRSDADIEAQAAWLISAWDALVKVRPEFGVVATPQRQVYRKSLISGSAVVIHGLIGAMSRMYTDKVNPAHAFLGLMVTTDGHDPLAIDDPAWLANGVVALTPEGTLNPRNSFQARRGAIKVLLDAMGIGEDGEDDE
ncbi:MAG: hypothetical protein ACT4P1_15870 [Sporichthyaceae bacterium]